MDPIRKIFVTNDGKASVDSPTAEYLEVPLTVYCEFVIAVLCNTRFHFFANVARNDKK